MRARARKVKNGHQKYQFLEQKDPIEISRGILRTTDGLRKWLDYGILQLKCVIDQFYVPCITKKVQLRSDPVRRVGRTKLRTLYFWGGPAGLRRVLAKDCPLNGCVGRLVGA